MGGKDMMHGPGMRVGRSGTDVEAGQRSEGKMKFTSAGYDMGA